MWIKTFGGVELKHAIGAKNVKGADFRNHILRDFTDNPVKTLLRLQRLRHQFAQPLQQHAGTGCQITHDRRGLLILVQAQLVAKPVPITRLRSVTPNPL